jgi:hypothetical protein
VRYTPNHAGTLTGNLIVTDNSVSPSSPQDVPLSGSTQQPLASFSCCGTLNFRAAGIGISSGPVQFQLTNTGGAPLVISSAAVTLDAAEFSQVNDCPVGSNGPGLAPGASCEFTVTFTPNASGQRNSTLTVLSNAQDNPNYAEGLAGNTGTQNIDFTPCCGLNFGNTNLNTTSTPQVVEVDNSGAVPLTITGITASGPFSIVAGSSTCTPTATAPTVIQPGQYCTVGVVFSPISSGSSSGNLTFMDDSGGSAGSQDFPLSGFSGAPSANICCDLNFGNTTLNVPVQSYFTISNNSEGNTGAPLAISNVSVSGASQSDFSLTNTCPASLQPGSQCTIVVTFTATQTTTESATVTIADNSGGGTSSQTVQLSGQAGPPQISFGGLGFSTTTVGQSSVPEQTTITNVGQSALTINAIAASGDFSQTNNCPATLQPQQQCTVTVVFTPTAVGYRTGSLTVTSNAGGLANMQETQQLSGYGQ